VSIERLDVDVPGDGVRERLGVAGNVFRPLLGVSFRTRFLQLLEHCLIGRGVRRHTQFGSGVGGQELRVDYRLLRIPADSAGVGYR
jgi:hypothetical protein